jgi:hypothetical protein
MKSLTFCELARRSSQRWVGMRGNAVLADRSLFKTSGETRDGSAVACKLPVSSIYMPSVAGLDRMVGQFG